MVVLIVASVVDTAAQNIADHLARSHRFEPVSGSNSVLKSGDVYMKHVETDGIYTDKLGLDISVDAVIFASRHRSESNEPTLTAHWTGNMSSRADHGGKPNSLSFTDPARLRCALLALDRGREERRLNYAVTLEATHHGPTELGVPTLFVEVGSTEKEWADPEAGAVASEAIWEAATMPIPGISALGFGGGHYCNKQSNALRKEGFAFSHLFPKYFFDEYDEHMIHQAAERTIGKCDRAVIDWKGVRGKDRPRLLDTLKGMSIEITRV